MIILHPEKYYVPCSVGIYVGAIGLLPGENHLVSEDVKALEDHPDYEKLVKSGVLELKPDAVLETPAVILPESKVKK